MMKSDKKQRLERAGFVVSDAAEFLGLSEAETAIIELRIALASELRKRRASLQLSQAELARLVHSSQSRVAKMEGGDASVSLDLLISSLLAMGTTRQRLGKIIAAA